MLSISIRNYSNKSQKVSGREAHFGCFKPEERFLAAFREIHPSAIKFLPSLKKGFWRPAEAKIRKIEPPAWPGGPFWVFQV